MPSDRKTVESLIQKLSQFRLTLDNCEREALDALLDTIGSQVLDSASRRESRLLNLRGAPEVASEIKKLKSLYDYKDRPDGPMAFPWTITTITTTIASHPWITCNIAAVEAQGDQS